MVYETQLFTLFFFLGKSLRTIGVWVLWRPLKKEDAIFEDFRPVLDIRPVILSLGFYGLKLETYMTRSDSTGLVSRLAREQERKHIVK